MNALNNLKSDNSGASAAEYALVVALIGAVIITAAMKIGPGINGIFTKSHTELVTATGTMQ